MVQNFDLTDKIIVVTGGYGHLGRAIVEHLIYHNAKVYVLGRNKEKFDEIFQSHQKYLSTIQFQYCDIKESDDLKIAFKEISNLENRIDVLINNAYFMKGQSADYMSDDDWNCGIDGTLNSVYRAIREIIPYMKEAKNGKIINMSSMYGMVAPHFEVYDDYPHFLNPPHYGAAKAGVIQLTKYYASYLGKNFNINVNCVSPGPFPSEIVQENYNFVNQLASNTCLNRIGLPEDLGGVFTFLASNASNYITGQNIIVDGGWTSK
jgi:NAD(P)-dependent dehydrogenase (short-subunit alcohol dehydrogenase family)